MTAITDKEIKKSAAELLKVLAQAKRKLFEFETLTNARTIQDGRFFEFTSAKDLLKAVKKGR